MRPARSRLRAAVSGSAPAWARLWARDSATVVGAQVSALVFTTALAVIVARYLGPAQFGIFAGYLGLAQVLMLVASVGVPNWLLRELSNALASERSADRKAANKKLSAALALIGGVAAVLTLGSLGVGQMLVSSSELALALGALTAYMGLLACATIVEVVLRAHRNLSRVVVLTLLEKVSLVGMVAIMTGLETGIPGIAAAYVAAGALRVAGALHAVRGRRLASFPRPTRADVASVARGSMPFALGMSVPSAIVRLDVFLIALLSAPTAGLYAVADRFLGVLLVIPTACASALYPHLARERDPVGASWRVAGALGAIGGLLAVGGILAAPIAVPLLFGSRYEPAVPGVRIMLLAAPLMFAASVLIAAMFSGGAERRVAERRVAERRVVMVTMTCSVSGTAFVLAGQALFGLQGAAAGYVCRYLAFLLGLAALACFRGRSGTSPLAVAAAGDRSAGDQDPRAVVDVPPAGV